MTYAFSLIIDITQRVASLLPFRLTRVIFCSLSQFTGQLKSSVKDIAKAQIKLAMNNSSALTTTLHAKYDELPEPSIDDLSHKLFIASLSHLGESLAELLYFKKLLSKNTAFNFKYIDSESDINFAELHLQKTPTLVLSGHIGNFELLAAFHRANGTPVNVVGRKPKYKIFNNLLISFRKSSNLNAIWRSDSNANRQIVSVIRNGESMAALIDHDTNLENSFSKFFGLEAASPLPLIRLALRYKLIIATSFIVRTSLFRHLVITKSIEYNPEDPHAEQVILDTFNNRLQTLMEQYPEQWLWWHRRWRRRPNIDYKLQPERLMSTKQYVSWIKSLTNDKSQ
jgi:KDO2-lipid IV(A) lauroyltransferase